MFQSNQSFVAKTSLAIMSAVVGFAQPAAAVGAQPVLMVIANQDFYWVEYAETRQSLEAAGLEVIVAAANSDPAIPQGRYLLPAVQPDTVIADVDPARYAAIVFSGGWGASMYQSDFPGTYANFEYNASPRLARETRRVIGGFVQSGKPVAAISHGVSVLAYARVDGQSLLEGRVVVADPGGIPGFKVANQVYLDAEIPTRWHIESNGATMLTANSIGDPHTSTDDVWVDGNIITAQDWGSTSLFAEEIVKAVRSSQ